MLKELRLHKLSTYGGFLIWGIASFMAQPTFASFLVHFGILPFAIAGTIYLAHHEAKES